LTTASVIDVVPAPLDAILELREDYRREMDCQIVHDSWHARGFTDAYLLRAAGEVVGYGSVGGTPGEPRDTVKEFFVVPAHRGRARALFRALVAASGARTIEAQTNDVLLSLMLFESATDLASETILFEDAITTNHPAPGARLHRLTDAERRDVFTHTSEPVGDWGLVSKGRVVATGGVLYHYNPPFGDLYMEVASDCQRRGFGTYLVQELKRVCRDAGRVPAARCHLGNHASRRTLERAGMRSCACIVRGRLTRVADGPDAPPAARS
jgi:GNAT superfamily N-acetyltransferase